MCSKKLDSILAKVPPATVVSEEIDKEINFDNNSTASNFMSTAHSNNKNEKLVAVIPLHLKTQIRQYLANNPYDTERSLVLKALKVFGFNIPIEEIKDRRRN